MPKKDHKKCVSCEEFYHMDEMTCTYEGEPLCEGCDCDDLSSPITVILPEEDTVCYKGSYTRHTDMAWNTDVGEDVVNEFFDNVGWKSSDAWRGHYEGKAPNGYTEMIGGWICGFDGAGTTEVRDFHELWEEDKEQFSGLRMFVAVMPSSNVFSTIVEVYVHDKDVDAFKSILTGEEKWCCDDCGTDFTSIESEVCHDPRNEDMVVCPECWTAISEEVKINNILEEN